MLFAYAQDFTDVSKQAGIDFLPVRNHIGISWGGIAVIDYNNDGYDDIYIPGGDTSDALYRNNGNGTFSNIIVESGIKKITDKFVTLTAIAGDIDNDGFTDLLVTTFSFRDSINTFGTLILLKNNGNSTFTDISIPSNVGRDTFLSGACSFGDVNNDGYLDIYVGGLINNRHDYNTVQYKANIPYKWQMGPDKLYLNQKNATFKDVAKEIGIVDPGASLGAAFFDYNNDANIDLYTANDDFATPDSTFPNKLFENQFSKSNFIDVAGKVNVDERNTAMGIAVGDYDENGFLDLYVTYCGRNSLLNNDGKGNFKNMAFVAGVENDDVIVADSANSSKNVDYTYTPYPGFVGLDSSKIYYCKKGTNDCIHLNFYIKVLDVGTEEFHAWPIFKLVGNNMYLEMEKNKISNFCFPLEDNYEIKFSVEPFSHGIEKVEYNNSKLPTTGWGANFLDYNNDGLLDLYVANGSEGYSGAMFDNTNSLYQNIGKGRFKDITQTSGANTPWSSRGSVTLDYDNDGDQDIFVMNMDYDSTINTTIKPYCILYRNNLLKDGYNNWLEIKLKGINANIDGVGAMLKAHIGFKTLIRQIDGGSSHMSSSTKIAHFGLGPYRKVDSLEVIWPGGVKQMVYNVAVNEKITIIQDGKEPFSNKIETLDSVLTYAYYNKINNTLDFKITSKNTKDVKLEVYDKIANKMKDVYSGEVTKNKTYAFTVSTKKYKSGIYYYKIVTPKGAISRKINVIRN
jgi:hypothetical protein